MSRPLLPVASFVAALVALAVGTLTVPIGAAGAIGASGQGAQPGGSHAALDEILDVNVRDGLVYYRALRSQRGRLDRYVAGLNVGTSTYEAWDRDARAAFWVNAYNAIVLRTVIDHYPIQLRSKDFPANSIRQIPGAFDRTTWRVAGKTLTLDQIEKEQVAAFNDPRMLFALGRGSVSGGRLRSEAFTGSRLDAQLSDVAADCVRRAECARADEAGGTLHASPVFSWREAAFVAALGQQGADRYKGRTPIELAIVAMIEPHLYKSERAWLAENTFKVRYTTYDWRLNDLTGGGPK